MNLPLVVNKITENIYIAGAPGKKDQFTQRILVDDIKALRECVDTVVCLMPKIELNMLQIANIEQVCIENNLGFMHYPIDDNFIPASLESFYSFLLKVDTQIKTAKICFICRGGFGRSGLAGACLLVLQKYSPEMAVSTVRSKRDNTLTRKAQYKFVYTFSQYVQCHKIISVSICK